MKKDNESKIMDNNDAFDLFGNDGKWIRFSNYTIKSDLENGFPIIIPDIENTSTVAELYSPFDKQKEILYDFLTLLEDIRPIIMEMPFIAQKFHDNPFPTFKGPIILGLREPFFYNPDDIKPLFEFAQKILRFNNKYGLFGLYDHYIESTKFTYKNDATDKRYLDNVNIKFKAQYQKEMNQINFDTYINEFIVDFYGDVNLLLGKHKYLYIGDQIFTLIFELYNFIKIKDLVSKFEHGKYNIDDNYPMTQSIEEDKFKITWKEVLNFISIRNIRIGVNFTEHPYKLEWNYSSLLEAIMLMFISELTIGGDIIKSCVACGRPFKKVNSEHLYCTEACNSRTRQARLQERKRTTKKLYKEGYTIQEISKRVNSSIKTITNWCKEVDESGFHQAKR